MAKGVNVIEALLNKSLLEQVPADPREALYLIGRARQHLETADREAVQDSEIAYDALYAAARKSLTAVLLQQGLRPTRAGGHEVVIEAAEAQLVPPAGPILRPYRRMRSVRAKGDYAASEGAISADDVRADLPAAVAMVDASAQIIDHLTVYVRRR